MLGRRAIRAFLLAACLTLVLPALASAQTFVVNSKGDAAKKEGAGAVCETGTPGECTLRAAIQASNVPEVENDTIQFDPALFNGEAGDLIAPSTELPTMIDPVELRGGTCAAGPCVAINGPPGFAVLTMRAGESVVEGLAVTGGSIGIRVIGPNEDGPGVEVLGNTISAGEVGIGLTGFVRGDGNLIEGNTIHVGFGNNMKGIDITSGPNEIYGNVIDGSCCLAGIFLRAGNLFERIADGNRIGGDTAASENVINGFQNGAIAMVLPEEPRNEVGRNRGTNGGDFIGLFKDDSAEPNFPNGIDPPVIAGALQSSAEGSAEPGANVRLFRKATEFSGEIEGFLGEAVADGSGNWKVAYAAVPGETIVAATQTNTEGGTSELSAIATTPPDPTPPIDACPMNTLLCPPLPGPGPDPGTPGTGSAPPAAPAPPADTTKPKLTITAAPKAKSEATTATFKFEGDEAGSSFQCKLDGRAWAKCRSPRTYRNLKPGKHVFRVRAVDPTGLVGSVAKRTFSVS